MPAQTPARRTDDDIAAWASKVGHVADQVEAWAAGQGWATHRSDKRVEEAGSGVHTFPFVRVRTPLGELHVNPIGLDILGGRARVDLEGWPTLNRVRLVGRDDGWQILTDSNVPLRVPWDLEAFLRLAGDLLSTG